MMHRRKFLQGTFLTAPLLLSGIHPSIERLRDQQMTLDVINAGRGGNNTVDLLGRIAPDCLDRHPDLTILMIGTNDMNSQKYVPLANYEQNLRSILSQIRDIGSEVLLMTILPVYEPYLYTRHPREFYAPEGHAERKKKVNEIIKQVAADYRQPVLDMHVVFERIGNIGLTPDSLIRNEANSGQTDGIHPTADGYRTMAVAIYEFIIARGLRQGRIVCFGDSITAGGGGTEGNSYPAYLKKLLMNRS